MALRVTRLLTVPLILAAMLVWGFLQTARAAAPAPDQAAASFWLAGAPPPGLLGVPKVVATSDQGLALEFAAPAFYFEPGQADGRPCQALHVDGWTASAPPGAPALPGSGALAGIPLDARLALQFLDSQPVTLPGHYDLCPVDEPVSQPGLPGDLPVLSGSRSTRSSQAYGSHVFQPGQPVELLGDGFIRSQRVARLRYSPFQYNPVSGELRYFPRLRVRLDFGLPDQVGTAAVPAGTQVDEQSFEGLLAKSLVNYDQARAWRQPAPSAKPGPQISAPQVAAPRYKLLVTRTGLQQITYQDLVTAGIDPSLINVGMLQVFYHGFEVPIQVLDGGDNALNSGDSFLFYGQQIDSRYSGTNVYYLTWGLFPGQRMKVIDGAPGPGGDFPLSFRNNVHFEQNKLRVAAYPSGTGQDVWYWDYVSGPGSKSLPASLSQVDTRPALTATLRGLLHSYAATPLHHTRIYVNNNLVKDVIWPPGGDLAYETVFPQAYLLEGANSIIVEAPRDLGVTHTQDLVLVNWFEISYQQKYVAGQDRLDFGLDQAGAWNPQVSGFSTSTLALYDVTDPMQPAQLQGFQVSGGSSAYSLALSQTVDGPRRYLALAPSAYFKTGIVPDKPSYWRTPNHAATDYLIISHRDLITEMQRLADYRASQGLKVALVDVEDIYDEFNGGVTDTVAIHDFLKYAYDNWQRPAPQYVLLVGDGNFDPRNYQGFNEPNFIPPYLAQTDPWLGEVAADNRFVTVSGADQLPDMHLGRIPVKTAAEARVVVDKILNYEKVPPQGGWNGRLLFVADNADDAGNFAQFSDAVADNLTPPGYSNNKIYYGVNYADGTLARQAIVSAINQGQLLVNYVGHSAIQFWASENLFGNNSLPSLVNTERLPFFMPMTCLDGSYFYPSKAGGADNSSLAESLLRASGKGSIGSFSATGFGVTTGHDIMNQRFFTAVFNQYVTQVGPATTLAKIALAATGDNLDLLDTYLLFGDPALNLVVLRPQVAIQKRRVSSSLHQGKTVQYSLVYTNTGPRLATGVVITDNLPLALLNPLVTSSGAAISPRPGSPYVWDVANLAPGAGGKITITAQLALNYYGPLTNTASISAFGELPPFNDNRATVVDPVYHWLYAPVMASATRP